MKKDFKDDLNFYLQKADRSKCSRRSDFNSLYIKYCQKHFGGKNIPEMCYNLEERINNFMDTRKQAKPEYLVYDKDGRAALISVIITPLMIRVHQKVCVLLDNAHFFFFFFFVFHIFIFFDNCVSIPGSFVSCISMKSINIFLFCIFSFLFPFFKLIFQCFICLFCVNLIKR